MKNGLLFSLLINCSLNMCAGIQDVYFIRRYSGGQSKIMQTPLYFAQGRHQRPPVCKEEDIASFPRKNQFHKNASITTKKDGTQAQRVTTCKTELVKPALEEKIIDTEIPQLTNIEDEVAPTMPAEKEIAALTAAPKKATDSDEEEGVEDADFEGIDTLDITDPYQEAAYHRKQQCGSENSFISVDSYDPEDQTRSKPLRTETINVKI